MAGKIKFTIPGSISTPNASRCLEGLTRGSSPEANKLLDSLEISQHYDLSPASRATGQQKEISVADDALLALEMEDGFIFYTSAQRLADDLVNLDPDAEQDGVIQLNTLRDRGPASRGLGDWLVRALSVIGFKEDDIKKAILDAALGKAREWVDDITIEQIEKGVSWVATKALMWGIESQLEQEPGLYRWDGDAKQDKALKKPNNGEGFFDSWQKDQPLLVFIHGTASSTLGSFGDLTEAGSAQEWSEIQDKYDRHIYAFEHRTFSESPIENALALARELPSGAKLSVVTHSRGGLVGDLLCAAALGEGLINGFDRGEEKLAPADEEDRKHLLELAKELARKKFIIERYLRVASPAQGTLLASSHLDAFLSALLHLIGLVPYLQVSPVYAVAKRIILQIAQNRTDPRLVPGIEAMLPDSPLAALVGQANPQENSKIAVIAGDIEGGGLLKRIGVFLTDHLFFEAEDNDLVVDTESMFGGIAREKGRYLFDQGADVSHFRYFDNSRTRKGLKSWLVQKNPDEIQQFLPIKPGPKIRMERAAPVGPQPVLFFLPGIMGSHLRVGDKDRVWFQFFDIARGGIEKISIDKADIHPDALFEQFYGDLCAELERNHELRRFPYDWRQPLQDEADRLAGEIDKALSATELPVRIMAHSMGGLVVRMMIARQPELWKRLIERDGSRFVMLGTPNQGSHLMVETLLGKSGTIRQLATLDCKHDLQELLDLIKEFPGALQLLPAPGFKDAGESDHKYYTRSFWSDFKQKNKDRWFFDKKGAEPTAELLKQTKSSWEILAQQKELAEQAEKIAYVAGYGQSTPCGVVFDEKRKRLRMVGTLQGDGSVSHASSQLEWLVQKERIWYMNADHTGLTGDEAGFPALFELLERGSTSLLPKSAPSVRGAEETFEYEAGPVLYPTEQSLVGGMQGAYRPPRQPGRVKYALKVSCHAMDLRHAKSPVMVGHYEGDTISGAEAQIDSTLVDGGLTLRYHMGSYASEPGTTTVVLPTPNAEQIKSGIQHGAVVVGLGEYGKLNVTDLERAVRDGVLRYLLQVIDCAGGRLPDGEKARDVKLTSLLLGYNSTTNISIADSVFAVVRGVIEANRHFEETMGFTLRVTDLQFVELYQDVAISAAYNIRSLGDRLLGEADRFGCTLEAADSLQTGKGVRQRLEVVSGVSYWPRLSITDAEHRDEQCPPECLVHKHRQLSLKDICSAECLELLGKDQPLQPQLPTHPQRRSEFARKLRFTYLSQRARAETEELQRQPGLVETLVESSIRRTNYNPELSNTLFQLLIPHDFKEAARQADNLVLVVDSYTANLPWELLATENEPLVKKTAMVRQFATSSYRTQVRNTLERTAYVVGDPSTKGFFSAFPDQSHTDADGLSPLPGAAKESQTVKRMLQSQGYDVVMAPSGTEGPDVINKLFRKDYRIVHISAHGVFQHGAGEQARSGVVLSDGLLLTAAEIGQLEVVPDLVFLNCCFLGKISTGAAYNRLAYSVARELIDIGVRAVVVSGWAVRDDAGEVFAETFYQALLHKRKAFGEAVHLARQKLLNDPSFSNCNTWGAYQAYGDPGFVMDPAGHTRSDSESWKPVAVEELVAFIDNLSNEQSYTGSSVGLLRKQLKSILKNSHADWLQAPRVLYALGRFYGEIGDFEAAISCYQQAIALDDKHGAVPARAIEQLANLKARFGDKNQQPKLIYQALSSLRGLVQAADGLEWDKLPTKGQINSERCALLGSTYKRLAKVLDDWSADSDDANLPKGAKQALQLSARWYECGEGILGQKNFDPYCAQNRLALEAVLGTARTKDAELALRAGEIARKRYLTSHSPFDQLMVGDGRLIARMIDRSLKKTKTDAVQEVIDSYQQVRKHLPISARELDSVTDQIDLLISFVNKRKNGEPNKAKELAQLVENLEQIKNSLKGRADGDE